MSRAMTAMFFALGISLLVNALTIERLSRAPEAPPPRPSRKAPPEPSRPSTIGGSAEASDPAPAPVPLRRAVERPTPSLAPMISMSPAPGATGIPAAGPPLPLLSDSVDPRVLEVVREQREFDTFWKDLKTVQSVRGQLERQAYLGAIVNTTADHLGLEEPARSRFIETARGIAADSERPQAPLWPGAPKAQQDALVGRFLVEFAATTERLKRELDLSESRQLRFASKLDTWILQFLPPEPAKPPGKF